jgi:hypothetical protein
VEADLSPQSPDADLAEAGTKQRHGRRISSSIKAKPNMAQFHIHLPDMNATVSSLTWFRIFRSLGAGWMIFPLSSFGLSRSRMTIRRHRVSPPVILLQRGWSA